MKSLRVASFNIRHGERPDGKVDNAALTRACEQLDVDILALQEVDAFSARSHWTLQHRRVSASFGGRAFFAPAIYRPPFGLYGIAMLSRLPVLDCRRIFLPRSAGLERRALMVLCVATKSGRITVASTHLSTKRHASEKELQAVMAHLAPLSEPKILVGDFNRPTDNVRELIGDRWDIADTEPTFPAEEPTSAIDIVATRGLEVEDVEVRRMGVSDHRAVLATVSR